jgi:hypothetical protein
MKKNSPRLHPAGLWSFMNASRQAGRQGLFADIESLMSGEKARIFENRINVTRWRTRRYCPERTVSVSEWGHRLAEAIRASAEGHARIARRPYLFLSGGLDSRIVGGALGGGIETISLCTRPNAEVRIAARVSRALGVKHRIIVRSPYWYLETVDASALVCSGIHFNQHAHFIKPAEIVMGAHGEAEFFLGDLLENFNKHYFVPTPGNRLELKPDSLVDFLDRFTPYRIKDLGRIGRLLNKDIRAKLVEEYRSTMKGYALSVWDVSDETADRLDTILRWANVGVTPTYNMITCLWPMARERNIYFDNNLDDLSLRIPAALRNGLLHTSILWRLDRKLVAIPDANTFVPPFFPKSAKILAKRARPVLGKLRWSRRRTLSGQPSLGTSGSWLLMHEVYRKDPQYRDHIDMLVMDSSVFPPEIFDPKEIKRAWHEFLQGSLNLGFEIEALRSFGSLVKLVGCGGLCV